MAKNAKIRFTLDWFHRLINNYNIGYTTSVRCSSNKPAPYCMSYRTHLHPSLDKKFCETSSSIFPSQLLSIPSQVSVAAGLMLSLSSLQSLSYVKPSPSLLATLSSIVLVLVFFSVSWLATNTYESKINCMYSPNIFPMRNH